MNWLLILAAGYLLFVLAITFVHATQWADPNEDVMWGGWLDWVFFAAGLIFWIVLLVLVMNRLIFHDPLPGRMVPTLAILIAPPAVGFLAWVQLNGGVLDGLARFLYAATLVFLGLALTQAGKLRHLPFGLSHWALSFPVAALTLATLRFGALADSPAHHWAGQAALIALCLIVGVLTLATLRAMARGDICRPE